jgi:hypothetical protein
VTHPSTQLWSEVVRIASLLHWSLDSILDLEHPVRRLVLLEAESQQQLPSVSPGGQLAHGLR